MKIKIEFNNLTIEIEAKTRETVFDAFLAGSATLKELQSLGYGKPKVTMDMEDFGDALQNP